MSKKIFLIFIPLLILFSILASPYAISEEPAAPAEKPAAEAPAEAKAEEPAKVADEKTVEEPKEDKEASGVWNPSLWEVVGAIVALVWGLIVGWAKLKDKDGTKKKITMAFEAAVQDTYTEFIRDLKAGKSDDGRLSKEDVKKAQGLAWDKAKDILSKQGVNLGKEVAVEYGPVLVTKIVKLFKKKKDD
jgi:hypothetical protein